MTDLHEVLAAACESVGIRTKSDKWQRTKTGFIEGTLPSPELLAALRHFVLNDHRYRQHYLNALHEEVGHCFDHKPRVLLYAAVTLTEEHHAKALIAAVGKL